MNVKRFGVVVSAIALPLALVSCGGDDDLDPGSVDIFGGDADNADELDEFADAFNDATGASGGSGMLVFDGEEFPIEAATCFLEGGNVDVGTVGANYRVFVSGDPADLSLQILDPESMQWFDGDGVSADTGGKATIDGTTVTGEENTWWNNSNDEMITASFVVECP